MAKARGNDPQEQLNQITHAAGLGSSWLADMAEQNLNALDGMLRTMRRAADAFGHQASSFREHSAALVEQSMGNAAALGTKLSRSRHPLDWAEAQSEFLSKQAQVMTSGAKSLGEALVNGSNEVTSAGLQQAREASRKGRRAA